MLVGGQVLPAAREEKQSSKKQGWHAAGAGVRHGMEVLGFWIRMKD
jgi:hypothetical protein